MKANIAKDGSNGQISMGEMSSVDLFPRFYGDMIRSIYQYKKVIFLLLFFVELGNEGASSAVISWYSPNWFRRESDLQGSHHVSQEIWCQVSLLG